MEIPYIVNARKDTGLNNSKIAIWLFLASEVMLFGGLFSSYIFLRIFADYPWPERVLPVLPGLLNTFILIASSVTVVFAWASLKLRNWKAFKGYMSFTILCAAVFMVLKGFEYSSKFNHQAIQYNDWTTIEGHTHYDEDHKPNNYYVSNAIDINFDLGSYYDPYLDKITTNIVDYDAAHGDRVTAQKQTLAEELWNDRTVILETKKADLSEEEIKNEEVFLASLKDYYTSLNYFETKAAQRVLENDKGDKDPTDEEEQAADQISKLPLQELLTMAKKALDKKDHTFADKVAIQRAMAEGPKISDEVRLKVYDLLKTNGYAVATSAKDVIINVFEDDKLIQKPLVKKGDEINLEGEDEGSLRYILAAAKESFIETRKHNEQVRESSLRQAWKNVKSNDGGRFNAVQDLTQYDQAKKDAANEENSKILESEEFGTIVANTGLFKLAVDNAEIKINPKWGRMSGKEEGSESTISLLDKTAISGKAGDSGMDIDVDAIDHRHLVMKARDRQYSQERIDEMIEQWYANLGDSEGAEQIRTYWEMHKKWRVLWTEELKNEYGLDDDGEPNRVPTDLELYRITWKHIVAFKEIQDEGKELTLENVKAHTPGMIDGFQGANHGKYHESFPQLHVARHEIKFESVFSPKMNNYYAIYFTITGIHGLHVIGGALVLGYYLFFGHKMYLANPEWLANRVEVGGLFWHFVDLVWIFAFPIFYLM